MQSTRRLSSARFWGLVKIQRALSNRSTYQPSDSRRPKRMIRSRNIPRMRVSRMHPGTLHVASFALLTVGWIMCTTALGFAEWRIWHMSNPQGLALVGIWKVCIYQVPRTHVSPFCQRYPFFDSYLPPPLLSVQYLLLLGSLVGLLGKVSLTMALRNVFMGETTDTKNYFLMSGFFSTFTGMCLALSVIYTHQAVNSEEGILFPPSFLMPTRPNSQELGNAILIASVAAFMMLLSGLLSVLENIP